jgi:MFS family permease
MRRTASDQSRESIYTPSILLLVALVGVSFLGVGFIMPLRAIYGERVGASPQEIGFMASAALLTGFCFAPVAGWLTDRFGHRRVLWVGILAHGFLVLAYIPAQNPLLLIGLRGLEGIAMAAILPPARALMNTIAPKARQGEASGLLSSAQMVGILLGPVLGTILASQVGYAPSFLVASVPLFLASVSARLFLPVRATEHASHVVAAQTAGSPALASRLFSAPLLLVYGLSAALNLTNGVITAIWSIYMLKLGASLPVIGLSYTTYAIPTALLTPVVGRLSDRRGRFWPLLAGLVLYSAVYVVFGLGVSPLWMVLLSAVEGIPAAFSRVALDGFLADVMPAGARGKAQANYSAAGTFGSFIGATAAGFLYAVSPGAPFLVVSAVFLVTACALLVPSLARLFPAREVARARVA